MPVSSGSRRPITPELCIAREDERARSTRAAEPAPEQEPEHEASAPERLAAAIGNRAFAQIARSATGILADGTAHPDVAETIARTRGRGEPLEPTTQKQVGGALGDPLGDVRVHRDETAERLTSAVAARAFTTGSDVYFARDAYAPGSAEGDRLLAHELSHVVQQRGAPTTGPLTVSQPGDPLEVEADSATESLSAARGTQLQRAATAPAGRVLARYDTGEHAQMGGDREVVINGVVMTEGEVIAMGDFYETPDKMRAAPVAELEHLLELTRRDKQAYLDDAAKVDSGAEHVSNAEWVEATKGPGREGRGFLDLAKANATHFAPRAVGRDGQDHQAEWWKFHKQALDKAHAATSSGDPLYNEALTDNAFGAHFLTDAFSAGHMVAKGDVMERAKAAWDRQKIVDGIIFKETEFSRGVAKRVLDDPKAGPKLKKYDIKLILWGEMEAERFSEFLWQMADNAEAKEEFFNNFVKIVHDALNEGISVGKGLDVENFNGEHWKLSGDDTLELSPDTLRISKAAVEESFMNLVDAAATKGGLAYDYYFAKVWDYTPKPTTEGRERMHDVLDTMLQPERPESQTAFAQVIINNIDTIIAALVEKGRLRDHEEAHAADYDRETDLGLALAFP